MKPPTIKSKNPHGFALVTTISLMVLLAVISIGLLGLSAISLRSSTQTQAQAEAQANARMALMIALGELQKEMGPDMRISAEAALFDENKETESIEGVKQPHWLASYDAWGDWLNASYTKTETGETLTIQDTYNDRRDRMFRRWLLSMPVGQELNDNAPLNLQPNDTNSVVMVGEGSLGQQVVSRNPEQVTRAYLNKVGDTGRHAWWISPENHKARIDLAANSRNLSVDEWETSNGNSAEMAVGRLPGLESIDTNSALAEKLITLATLRPAQVTDDAAKELFFDLTAHSEGVLASVRTGHLKKDLSLLFEQDGSRLPAPYRFNPGRDIVEPSIRPMSPDIASKGQLRNRHFQSWTNMRHYYRMYRQNSDATIGGTATGNSGAGALQWDRGKPFTSVVSTSNLGGVGASSGGKDWDGSNNYWRVPILAKITFIYSLLAEPVPGQAGRFRCYHVFSPVFTYWNPYNTELRIPDGKITMASSAYRVWPHTGDFYINGVRRNTPNDDWAAWGTFGYSQGINAMSVLRSERSGTDIVFKPGEFRVFSYRSSVTTGSQAAAGAEAPLYPGFDPGAISGEKKDYGPYSPRGAADGTFTQADRPGLTITFSHGLWGGNINRGNTGGSLCWQDWWDRSGNPSGMPLTYANDWFNKAQTMTPMTPAGAGNIAYWVFDGRPLPVAFCQLVIKGQSEYNYESIGPRSPAPHNWARDWRSRNWIQSPPFYFGHGMYCSENETTAHTQRIDNPYIVYFGPTSMSEMPKVVGQVGQNSFLGSGSNPFEKVTRVSAIELPTAPPGSLAAFASMRINPGWTRSDMIGVDRDGKQVFFANTYGGSGWDSSGEESLYAAETKRVAYQSGVTGPGIGNSFMHPMLPRNDIYRFFDNSKSEDVPNRRTDAWMNTITRDSKAYCDYWDHVFLLNDALWDDYFVSSLADQTRPGASAAVSLSANIDRLINNQQIANSRFRLNDSGLTAAQTKAELQAADGYLKAAKHLSVEGMFNVNSTSVSAWYSLFAGIRERQLTYRDGNGRLQKIDVPSGKRIAVARFNTETSDKEMLDPEFGVNLPDGSPGWSGVRFLDDSQLMKLAEECVKQVKLRGPFLNFSEFINRRLSSDNLGLMGALQAAIDYDDASPDSRSINYAFKNGPDFMMKSSAMGRNGFTTPQAAEGSRFAGIPGYVIQSDLLKPIANTLSVRDDTFRIRAYGEARDASGTKVLARAWCEAIVQRVPEYCDPANEASVPARTMSVDGRFSDNNELTATNRRFGRKFQIQTFRWLNAQEV